MIYTKVELNTQSLFVSADRCKIFYEAELRAMNPHDFADWVVGLIGEPHTNKSGDGGIDGWTKKGWPIQVKSWKMPVPDQQIKGFFASLVLVDEKRGIFIAWRYHSGCMRVAREFETRGVKILLWTVKDLLQQLEMGVIEDTEWNAGKKASNKAYYETNREELKAYHKAYRERKRAEKENAA